MLHNHWRVSGGSMYFGQFLIDNGIVTQEQLNDGLADQAARPNVMIGTILVEKGYIEPETLEDYLLQHMALCAEKLGVEIG